MLSLDDILDRIDNELPSAAHAGDTGTAVTAPTRVFRVEMPNGEGPYNSGLGDPYGEDGNGEIYDKLYDWGCVRLATENHEHMGETEGAFREAHGHADYGCDSVEAIHNWFPLPARQYLSEKWGAKLVEYEIPGGRYLMAVGNGEVVFDKHSATEIARHELV